MPNPPNPEAIEFYVYRFFLANGNTFYVGKGHWPHWPPGKRGHRADLRGKFVSGIYAKGVAWQKEKKELQVLKRLHFDLKEKIYWEFLNARFPIGAPGHSVHPERLSDICSRSAVLQAHDVTDSPTAEDNEKRLIL